jgi:Protein of unknown function (DUF2637)
VNLRRFAAALADTAPVLVLATIAGAGSFTHIRDTASQHGQHGPMAWAVAVCIDLTCVMAARERQRDKRHGNTRRVSWPTLVLAGGILLSLAANLAQAQPSPWGRIVAGTPSASFLVAVSMLERRATRAETTQREITSGQAVPAVPVQDGQGQPLVLVPSPSQEPNTAPSPSRPADTLVDFARRVAADHERAQGEPITRDKLRARLGVSNQLASDLLHQIRTPVKELQP